MLERAISPTALKFEKFINSNDISSLVRTEMTKGSEGSDP